MSLKDTVDGINEAGWEREMNIIRCGCGVVIPSGLQCESCATQARLDYEYRMAEQARMDERTTLTDALEWLRQAEADERAYLARKAHGYPNRGQTEDLAIARSLANARRAVDVAKQREQRQARRAS